MAWFPRLRCPVCGKLSAVNRYHLDHRLELVNQRGLGRGRGFETERVDLETSDLWPGYVKVLTGRIRIVWRVLTGGSLYVQSDIDDAYKRGYLDAKHGEVKTVFTVPVRGIGKVTPKLIIKPKVKI